MLANSSFDLIWPHLVCILDHYSGLLPFLANDIAVFVSVLSTVVILLYYMVQISPVEYHFTSIHPNIASLFFQLMVYSARGSG